MKKDKPESTKNTPNLTIALAGNPNAGKTTLFNALTGLRHKVANYPGVTVEKREGNWSNQESEKSIRVIDLPGLYSLDATSIDEEIARDVLTEKRTDGPEIDVTIAVVDATNLERNLYLVTQILEHQRPVVIALTMFDIAEKRSLKIDVKLLSELLNVPVIPVNAAKKSGIEELYQAVQKVASQKNTPLEITSEETSENSKIFARYNFISDIYQKTVKRESNEETEFSEKVDRILTHKVFGLGVLAIILLFVFQTIFTWSELPMNLLEQGFGQLGDLVKGSLEEGLLSDLLVEGVIAGVGGVVVFLPQILLLFFFLSLLEDSGYMARAAFLLDRLMRGVGLHGKAFLPLLSSFACAIPGIMATRTIENNKDRLATILIAPLMSCSARLPVYTLMIGAFFSGDTYFGFLSTGAVLMLSMYLLGILVAVIVAWILKRTLLKAPPPPLLMELPPYRLPNLKTVFLNMFEQAFMFLKRAGTVILAISIILWALTTFPRLTDEEKENLVNVKLEQSGESCGCSQLPPEEQKKKKDAVALENSYAGMLGQSIEPAIQPLGFDWKIGVALIASFAAREVLVSTLSIIYSVGKDENEESETLINAVRDAKNDNGENTWTPLTAVTVMVFFVLALQCMSTVVVVRKETNSWLWTGFMIVYMTSLAYLGALITYQGGKYLGF